MMKDKISSQVLLLNISRTYKNGMDIKQAVSRAWGKPSRDTDFVLAIADGQVKGVFLKPHWYKDKKEPKLWAFNPENAPIEIHREYENRKFRMYGRMGYAPSRDH